MTSAQVLEMLVTTNSPSSDSNHVDEQLSLRFLNSVTECLAINSTCDFSSLVNNSLRMDEELFKVVASLVHQSHLPWRVEGLASLE